jgi:hypothetical protein
VVLPSRVVEREEIFLVKENGQVECVRASRVGCFGRFLDVTCEVLLALHYRFSETAKKNPERGEIQSTSEGVCLRVESRITGCCVKIYNGGA